MNDLAVRILTDATYFFGAMSWAMSYKIKKLAWDGHYTPYLRSSIIGVLLSLLAAVSATKLWLLVDLSTIPSYVLLTLVVTFISGYLFVSHIFNCLRA